MNLPRVESFWQTDDDEDIWQTIIAILERLSWTDYLKNKENGNENSLYEKNEINKHRQGNIREWSKEKRHRETGRSYQRDRKDRRKSDRQCGMANFRRKITDTRHSRWIY